MDNSLNLSNLAKLNFTVKTKITDRNKETNNEDEKLICQGGKRDLIMSQQIDEMSEIADVGAENLAEADASFANDEEADQKSMWTEEMVQEFN